MSNSVSIEVNELMKQRATLLNKLTGFIPVQDKVGMVAAQIAIIDGRLAILNPRREG